MGSDGNVCREDEVFKMTLGLLRYGSLQKGGYVVENAIAMCKKVDA